jgi:hypothetical protein
VAFQALETDDDEYDGLAAPAPARHNHLRLVGVSHRAARPSAPPLPGAARLLNWLRHYLAVTNDRDLVLVPWVDYENQPACTIGRQPTMRDLKSKMLETTPAAGAVTPQRWTRQDLAKWAGVLDGSPQPLPGLDEPEDAMKVLSFYRDLVESRQQ